MKSFMTLLILVALGFSCWFAWNNMSPEVGEKFKFLKVLGDKIGITKEDSKKTAAGERVVLEEHGCSLQVPAGWVRKAGEKGGVMFVYQEGAQERGALIIDSEEFKGSVREFTDAHVENTKKVQPESQFLQDTKFATDSGISAYKVILRNRIRDVYLAQGMYFFDGPPGRKIKATYAASVRGDSLEPLFDSCLKTLQIVDPNAPPTDTLIKLPGLR